MSSKMTSSIIPLNESNLSSSSGEIDFIFKVCKVTQSFCVVSDVEVKKAPCGGSGLLVLGKNRKYIPDRSLLSSE